MIRQVELHSFKGFRDFTIEFGQFTSIVGLNSRGKTSILQAIRFAHELLRFSFGNGRTADFGSIQWQFGPADVLSRYSPSDPAALWFDRNTTSPCAVTLTTDDGMSFEAKVSGPSMCQLDVKIGNTSMRGQALTPQQKGAIQSILDENPVYVPPLGATSGVERWVAHDAFIRQLQEGRYNETWRNSLYWLYNDGDKERYKEVVELVNRYIPESMILPPRLSHTNPPSVLIDFVENAQKYDIGLSGAGLRSLLNLASVLLLSDSRLLLLDEPDSHLHSRLQRVIARMVYDFAAERGIQIITATHAPDFIAEIPVECVLWVDRSETDAKAVGTLARALVDLGSISNAEAVTFSSSDAVLFVEGTTDKRVLAAIFDKCGLRNPVSDPTVLVAKLPDGKSSADGVRMLPPLLRGLIGKPIRVACLVDNDWQLLAAESEIPDGGPTVCLTRKEIENFLIEPETFSRAVAAIAQQRLDRGALSVTFPNSAEVEIKLNEILESVCDSVRCQLIWRFRDTLASSLDRATREQRAMEWFTANWSRLDWRLRAAPGKQVLAQLRRWCQEKYGLTVTDKLLLGALAPVPDDLRESLGAIAQLIYSKDDGGESLDNCHAAE